VIRGPQGGGIRLAAQHSQSLEAWFIHVPGLVVVAPSTPGTYRLAIRPLVEGAQWMEDFGVFWIVTVRAP